MCDPLLTHTIPEHLRGESRVMNRYTGLRLLSLQLLCYVQYKTHKDGVVRFR